MHAAKKRTRKQAEREREGEIIERKDLVKRQQSLEELRSCSVHLNDVYCIRTYDTSSKSRDYKLLPRIDRSNNELLDCNPFYTTAGNTENKIDPNFMKRFCKPFQLKLYLLYESPFGFLLFPKIYVLR